jgi:hypothetical protein
MIWGQPQAKVKTISGKQTQKQTTKTQKRLGHGSSGITLARSQVQAQVPQKQKHKTLLKLNTTPNTER